MAPRSPSFTRRRIDPDGKQIKDLFQHSEVHGWVKRRMGQTCRGTLPCPDRLAALSHCLSLQAGTSLPEEQGDAAVPGESQSSASQQGSAGEDSDAAAQHRVTAPQGCSGGSGHSANTAKEIKHLPPGLPARGQGPLPYAGSFALLVSLRSDTDDQLQPSMVLPWFHPSSPKWPIMVCVMR